MSDNRTLRSTMGQGSFNASWSATNNEIVVVPNASVPKGQHWVVSKASARAAVAAGGLPGNDLIGSGFFLLPNGVTSQIPNFSLGANDAPVTQLNAQAPIRLAATFQLAGSLTWQALQTAGWFGVAFDTIPGDIIVPGGWTIALVLSFSGVAVTAGIGYLDLLFSAEPDC